MFLMSPYSENLSMMSSSCASSWRPFTNTIQPSIAGGGGGDGRWEMGDGRWERDEKERGGVGERKGEGEMGEGDIDTYTIHKRDAWVFSIAFVLFAQAPDEGN